MKMDTLLWIAGAGALLYFLSQQQTAAGGTVSTTATPYSIYPSMAYTAASMATNPAQKAPTVIPANSLYTSTQQQAVNALTSQCAGSYPACTPMLGDTQLGL